MNARCYDHKDTAKLPAGCATCRRIELEARIVKKTVNALLEAGYALRVDDGEELRPAQPTTNKSIILAELMLTDDDYLQAHLNGKSSWVRFVYGNDGWDVISDYTTDLEQVLQAVNDYAVEMGG